jgi:predicted secreted Zn-dependent protease
MNNPLEQSMLMIDRITETPALRKIRLEREQDIKQFQSEQEENQADFEEEGL